MKYRLLAVTVAIAISVCLLNVFVTSSFAGNNESAAVKFDIDVLDADLSRDVAEVNITITISNLSFTPLKSDENVTAVVSNDIETVKIACKNDTENIYSGCSGPIPWTLTGDIGKGEYFPFEQYELVFRLTNILFATRDPYNKSDVKIDSSYSFGRFNGPKKAFLASIFKADNSTYLLPSNSLRDLRFVIYLSRNLGPFALPTFFWMLIAPIIACYFMLCSTLILEGEKTVYRLSIYIALFFFCPTFLTAIQEYLPLRATLSIPEVLIVVLMTNAVIFAISSFIRTIRTYLELSRDGIMLFASSTFTNFLFINLLPVFPTGALPVFIWVFSSYFFVSWSIFAWRLGGKLGKEFRKDRFDPCLFVFGIFGFLLLIVGLICTPLEISNNMSEAIAFGIVGTIGLTILASVMRQVHKQRKKSQDNSTTETYGFY